jgi:hypothetical protein
VAATAVAGLAVVVVRGGARRRADAACVVVAMAVASHRITRGVVVGSTHAVDHGAAPHVEALPDLSSRILGHVRTPTKAAAARVVGSRQSVTQADARRRAARQDTMREAPRQGRGCARSRAASSSNSVAPLRGRRGKSGADQTGQLRSGPTCDAGCSGWAQAFPPFPHCGREWQLLRGFGGAMGMYRIGRGRSYRGRRCRCSLGLRKW